MKTIIINHLVSGTKYRFSDKKSVAKLEKELFEDYENTVGITIASKAGKLYLPKAVLNECSFRVEGENGE